MKNILTGSCCPRPSGWPPGDKPGGYCARRGGRRARESGVPRGCFGGRMATSASPHTNSVPASPPGGRAGPPFVCATRTPSPPAVAKPGFAPRGQGPKAQVPRGLPSSYPRHKLLRATPWGHAVALRQAQGRQAGRPFDRLMASRATPVLGSGVAKQSQFWPRGRLPFDELRTPPSLRAGGAKQTQFPRMPDYETKPMWALRVVSRYLTSG